MPNVQRIVESIFDDFKILQAVGHMPTYEQFCNRLPRNLLTLMMQIASKTLPQHVGSEVTASVEFFYPIFIGIQAGRRTFRLGKDILRLLADTDLPLDTPLELLKVPFEGIFLDVPEGVFDGAIKKLKRIYVTHVPGDTRLRIAYPNDDSTLQYVNMFMDGVETLGEAIQATWIRSQEFFEEFKAKGFLPSDYLEETKTGVFRVAINSLLYISAPDADVVQDKREVEKLRRKLKGLKKGYRKEMLQGHLDKASKRYIYIVGRSVAAPKDYEKFAGLRKTAEGRKILVRFRVRGHFKQQAYGKGRAERKLKWIAPHWKGPTFAECVARGYLVK